jgi:hypothetical protein
MSNPDPLHELRTILASPCDLAPLDGLVANTDAARALRSTVRALSNPERKVLARYLCNIEQLNITPAMLTPGVLDALALLVQHRKKLLPLLANDAME